MDVVAGESNECRSRLQKIPELIVFSEENYGLFLESINMALKETELNVEHPGFLKWLAFDRQRKFNRSKRIHLFRAALTAYGELELKKKLGHLKKMIEAQPDTPFTNPSIGAFYGTGTDGGAMAYLYPGQGSQYLGMGKALAAVFPEARRSFNRLARRRLNGHTLEEIISSSHSIEKADANAAFMRLCGSEWANPCISVVGEPIFALLKRMGAQPDAVASHSFGDVSAFRAAGIITEDDMLQMHRHRGKLGASCPLATSGCILVVRETAENIVELLNSHNIEDIWIANYNTTSQTVVSGLRGAIQIFRSILKKAKIVSQLIPISGAPHCPLTRDVARKFGAYLDRHIDFKNADCDVYSYLFGRKVKNDPDLLKRILGIHIEKPVRFKSQIENMYKDGIRIFVEVGPSDVLTLFVEDILEGRPHLAINTDSRRADSVLTFLQAVAGLFKAGKIFDLGILWEGYEAPRHPRQSVRQHVGFLPEDLNQLQKLELKIARIENMRSL